MSKRSQTGATLLMWVRIKRETFFQSCLSLISIRGWEKFEALKILAALSVKERRNKSEVWGKSIELVTNFKIEATPKPWLPIERRDVVIDAFPPFSSHVYVIWRSWVCNFAISILPKIHLSSPCSVGFASSAIGHLL